MDTYRNPAAKIPMEIRFKQVVYANSRMYGLTESGELYQAYWDDGKIVEWRRIPMIIKEDEDEDEIDEDEIEDDDEEEDDEEADEEDEDEEDDD